MNKALKGLLVAMLAVSATVQAHTNKTFLLPRSHGVNLPMEMSTFCELVHRKDADKFGANFQAVGFYSGTTNEKETGEYFGILKDKAEFKLSRAVAGVDIGSTDNVDLGLFVHELAATAAKNATVKLNPSSEVWGVRFDYYQDLEKILKGLYLKVVVPVVHVENDMEVKVTSAHDQTQKDLTNFLNGTLAVATAGADRQKQLTNALIGGKNSTTGVADIDVVLGYNFLCKDKCHAGINLGFTIPTGDDADGKHAFEAIAGNGDHWAFGAGLCGGARVWGDHDHNVKIKAGANYRYLFEGTEKRTLGLRKDENSEAYNWGHYMLLAKVNDAETVPLTPAANLTTLNCDVTPGSQLDAVVAVAYNNGGIAVDFGYNVFWKDDEEVKLKKDQLSATEQWGIAVRNFNAGAGANVAPATHFINGAAGVLTEKNLSTKVAETPSQVTHKIFASLGYIFKSWECPLMAGLGGGYEFAGSNAALEKWEIWLKLGVGF